MHPTTGTNFTVTRAIFRPTWTPPKSAWAANLKFQPAGINNPMGLLKLDLGGYSEFIHGVPKSEEANLGKAASHGCLRISTANVLYLFQHYAGAGTTVTINRNLALSNQWAAQFTAAGGKDHVITDGAELIPLVLSGKNPAVLEYHD